VEVGWSIERECLGDVALHILTSGVACNGKLTLPSGEAFDDIG
jgi:hypothetical protein